MTTYTVVFTIKAKDLKIKALTFHVDAHEGVVYFYQEDVGIPVAMLNLSAVASIKAE